MAPSRKRGSKCACCSIPGKKYKRYKKYIRTENEVRELELTLKKAVKKGDFLCNKCRCKLWQLSRKSGKPVTKANKNAGNIEPSRTTAPGMSLIATSQAGTSDDSGPLVNPAGELRTDESTSMNPDSLLLSPSDGSSSPSTSDSDDETFTVPTSPSICVPFRRIITARGSYCCICKKASEKMITISLEARVHCFQQSQIFIPRRNRCCCSHIRRNRLLIDCIEGLEPFADTSDVEVADLSEFMEKLCSESDKSIFEKVSDHTLSDERFKALTGYSFERLRQLEAKLVSMNNTVNRTVLQALVVFLFKMRSGNSNSLIAAIFSIPTKRKVAAMCCDVLDSFEKDVLPYEFGVKTVTREYLMYETSFMAKRLHHLDGKVAVICDGTYLRHQKSTNNAFQRKSFSGQKNTYLCKPFTVCTTNGFVVELSGPFKGTATDGAILKAMMADPNGLTSILKPGDTFILDRGFRDVVQYLQDAGYNVLMPAVRGREKRFSTEQANKSRLVTKVRWVVEVIHGIISKKFKLLHNQVDNNLLPRMRTYCRIACYLLNLFGHRLYSDQEMESEIIERMLKYQDEMNRFSAEVDEKEWERRKTDFRPVVLSTGNDIDFPVFTEKQLIILFTGSFQIAKAISCISDLSKDNGVLTLETFKETRQDGSIGLKFIVPPMYKSKQPYRCFILYRPTNHELESILGYACSCSYGLRTVGCCSHIATIIYYLSYGRHLSRIVRPAERLTKLFDRDQIPPPPPDENDGQV